MKRIIGLVLLVLAIAGTVNVVRKFSQEDTTRTTGNAAYDRGRKVGKYSAPGVLLLLGLYGLRLLFSSDESPRPAAPIRRSPTGNLPPPGHPSLRGGQDTFASNPACLRISAWQWLAANPWVPWTCGGLAVAGLAVLFIKLPVGIILLLTAVILAWQEVREAKQKFFGGDVCPGVVLSAEQNLVAVYTDLAAASHRPHPVIQILKQPLQRMTATPAFDGMRVATAALYAGNVQDAAWNNFMPEVIDCVVRDPAEIERVLGSISEEEWQMLDAGLAQVPVASPGLYPVSIVNPATGAADVNAPPSGVALITTKPWYKTTVALIAFSAVGLVAGLMIVSYIIGTVASHRSRPSFPDARPGYAPPQAGPPRSFSPPPQHSPGGSFPAQPTQTGPYSVGSKVEANWAGGWVPGQVTQLNPGGFSVMVQLNDRRFPNPIVLSTNQLRLK